jgi:hypothetical protein
MPFMRQYLKSIAATQHLKKRIYVSEIAILALAKQS